MESIDFTAYKIQKLIFVFFIYFRLNNPECKFCILDYPIRNVNFPENYPRRVILLSFEIWECRKKHLPGHNDGLEMDDPISVITVPK